MATTAATAHRIAATVNAPVKPCVSAAGSVEPACSALVIRDVETADRIARPSDPPTCWVVLSSPEASPESSARHAARRGDRDRHERHPQPDAEDDHRRQHVTCVVAVTGQAGEEAKPTVEMSSPPTSTGLGVKRSTTRDATAERR